VQITSQSASAIELHGRDDHGRASVLYLVPWYPAISHTFILREVQALRRLGRRVTTASIHRARPEDLQTHADREANATTYALSPPRLRDHLEAHWQALRLRRRSYVSTLASALHSGPTEPAVKARSVLYFCEGVVTWWHSRQSGTRHIHGVFAGPAADAARLAARLGGEGWTWSFAAHGTDMLQVPRASLAAKIRSASFVTVSSDFGRSQLMMLVGQKHWSKIHVVHCGIDMNEYDGTPHPAAEDGIDLITVGRLEREKGHALLLEALAILERDRNMRVGLTVVGDGSEMGALREQANRLAIADRVRFLGRVGQDEIRNHYARADAFCLSSLGEGIPVVLMEAMAMRMPVVAPRIMGIPELIEDGVSGLLVSPGRADALADAIATLAARSDQWPAMGQAGRARISERFEIAASARRLDAIFARWADTTAPAGTGR
jgi:colanic acid/amylovoran biosynthesis glycosyltransferase